MKSWFEYEYGYLVFDKENLYFTNTGNGSEIRNLKELPYGKSRVKRKHPFYFLGAMVLPFCYLLYEMGSTVQSFIVMACFLGVFYFVYKYLKREMGISMWILLNRIESIEISSDFAEISYRDNAEEIRFVSLDKIEFEGIELLTQLKSTHADT